jgi:hypothetical protein
LLRSLKLVVNFALTACFFSFFILLLVGLLNPGAVIRPGDMLPLYLNLLIYYGPLWFVFIALVFFVVQFFSERKYPIGFFKPPTSVYFFSFTVLAVSIVIYITTNTTTIFGTAAVTVHPDPAAQFRCSSTGLHFRARSARNGSGASYCCWRRRGRLRHGRALGAPPAPAAHTAPAIGPPRSTSIMRAVAQLPAGRPRRET